MFGLWGENSYISQSEINGTFLDLKIQTNFAKAID